MPTITCTPDSGPGPFRICIVGGTGVVTATDGAVPTQHADALDCNPCFDWTPSASIEKGPIVLSSPGCTDLVIELT